MSAMKEVLGAVVKLGTCRVRDIAVELRRDGFVIAGSLARLEKRKAIKKVGQEKQERITVWLWGATDLGKQWAERGIPKVSRVCVPGDTAKARRAYERYHAKHVERQRLMGLSAEQINDVFDVRDYKGKEEAA